MNFEMPRVLQTTPITLLTSDKYRACLTIYTAALLVSFSVLRERDEVHETADNDLSV